MDQHVAAELLSGENHCQERFSHWSVIKLIVNQCLNDIVYGPPFSIVIKLC